MEVPMDISFVGAPSEMVLGFQANLGVIYQIGDHTVSSLTSVLILVCTSLLFFALGVWKMMRPSKR